MDTLESVGKGRFATRRVAEPDPEDGCKGQVEAVGEKGEDPVVPPSSVAMLGGRAGTPTARRRWVRGSTAAGSPDRRYHALFIAAR